MRVAAYLPSSQFSVTVVSIALAGALIVAAQYVTSPHGGSPQVAVEPAEPSDANWKTQLDEIQAQAPGIPDAPTEETVATLLEGAKSNNLTDTVARSLLVNLSNANAQGLGNDIPTQDKIILSAAQAAAPSTAPKAYGPSDLTLAENTQSTQRSYGNAAMQVLGRHTGATSGAVLLALSKATDTNDPKELQALARIQADYEGLVSDLATVPVPKNLLPLHLQALNDLSAVALSIDDMQKLFEDPLRSLRGLQQYKSMLGEVGRIFTSIAETLAKNGILFSKDEPGNAWNVFVSSYPQ